MPRSSIFGGLSSFPNSSESEAFDPSIPLSAIPAGFQSILQFSTHLLERTLTSNLAQVGLGTLSTRVPYQPELVAPKLSAAIGPHLTLQDQILGRVPHVEVVLTGARLQTLRSSSQPRPERNPQPRRGVGTDPGGSGRQRRIVDLKWKLQVNLFKEKGGPSTEGDILAGSGGRSGGARSMIGGRLATSVDLAGGVLSTGEVPATQLPEGHRFTLAEGTILMHVPTDLVEFPTLLQFWLSLNFDGVDPIIRSDDPTLVEFLDSELAIAMIAQALAPLLARSVRLSPSIALAGNLTSSQVESMHLPALHVQDLTVLDEGREVLALCVSLGEGSTGVLSDFTGVPTLVRSFLNKRDFAYYVSDRFFVPVLTARWRANAIRTPIVSDVPVEMPVEAGSEETGEGLARVQVNLSDTLKESGIKVSLDNRFGDPLRLVSEQTVHLRRLWSPNGDSTLR